MLAFDNRETADTGTDEHARTFGQLRTDRQAGLLHRALRGSDRVVDERIHLLDVFFLEPAERIEIFNFGGNPGGKLRGIKTGDGRHTAAPFAQVLPRFFGSRSQRRYQTDAGDHDSSFLQNTTSKT